MTTNSHINSGINEIAITEVSGNVIGIDVSQLNIANVSGFYLPGGIDKQVVSTDGAANLSWQTAYSGVPNTVVQGNSNITISVNGNISFNVSGDANIMTISNSNVTINKTVDFGNVDNIRVTGAPGAGIAVIGNDSDTSLQFEQELLIPESGYGYGRLIARGSKIFRAGDGSINQRVLGWFSGTTPDVATEIPINCGSSTQPKYWQKIHTNISCIYALADTGVLYCSGYDNNGQQGTGATVDSTATLNANLHPTIYGPGITVVDFWSYVGTTNDSINTGACMVTVDDNGTFKTYIFGYNEDGVLGNGTLSTPNHVPTYISEFGSFRPISVSFHQNTCMVVLSSGSVYGSGNDSTGHLGTQAVTLGNITTFTECGYISASGRIVNATEVFISSWVDAAANGAPSEYNGVNAFIRRADDSIWACGTGGRGRLAYWSGGTPIVGNQLRFVRCSKIVGGMQSFMNNIAKIKSSNTFTMILDTSGNLYTTSTNLYGWWGIGGPLNIQWTAFTIIQTGITDFYVMQRDRGGLALFINKDGKTYASGLNTQYQLGTMDISANVTTSSRVVFSEPNEYATNIVPLGTPDDSSTWNCATLFKTNKNRVYIAGRMANIGSYGGSSFASSPVEITDVR